MTFFKKIFKPKATSTTSYADFWNWFSENEKQFFSTVKQQKDIEKNFFQHLFPKLDQLKDGIFFLTGMHDDNTAELIFTPDGIIKNIAFIEELVGAAPEIEGWLFTALKPAMDIKNVSIQMAGYVFNRQNLFFYSNDNKTFPDEIDITVVYTDYSEKDKAAIANGVYIFLDNFLGELHFATTIDSLTVIGKEQAENELVPIEKLKDFLIWREKEFIEKYDGIRHNTENDEYVTLEAKLESGKTLIAVVNSTLMNWDSKASHTWMLSITMKYDGNTQGMPDKSTYEILNSIEEEIMAELKDEDGYLNVGRQTADGEREIYFACKDFRKPSMVMHHFAKKFEKFNFEYDIFKDKYWRSLDRFKP